MLKYCYYLNLEKREDRRKHIENELDKSCLLSTIYERFPAIDGTLIHPRSVESGILTENAICDILSDTITAWGLSLTQGGLGVLLSYLELFNKISKLDSPAIIFEDDSIIDYDFDDDLTKIYFELPEDFDICYLGYADMDFKFIQYSESLSKPVGMLVCLPSLIVSPKGAEKLLKVLKNIDHQIDTAMYNHFDELNVYVSNKKIVKIKNQFGTDIQGNNSLGKKYKKQDYIITTLAFGNDANENAVKLAKDLDYFGQELLVVTDRKELFKNLNKVITVDYPNKSFSYNDKILCFEEGFKHQDAVIFIDSDARIFYKNIKTTYGNLQRIIESGYHPSWDWGKVARFDGGFFTSTDIPHRVKGYGEYALEICKAYGIPIEEAFHFQEGMLVVAKENEKELKFLKMWKTLANKLDDFERSNDPNGRIGVGEGNLVGLALAYSGMTIRDPKIINCFGDDLKYNYLAASSEYNINFPDRKILKSTEGVEIKKGSCVVAFKGIENDIVLSYSISQIDKNELLLVFDWDLGKSIEFLDHEFKIGERVFHFNSNKTNEFNFENNETLIYHTYDWYGEKDWKLIAEL